MSDLKLSIWERHKGKILAIVIIALLIVSVGAVLLVVSLQQQKTTLVVYHAGSLTVPFGAYAAMWEASNPTIAISNQPYGSSDAIRQVTTLNKSGDIVASSDYSLIKTMMMTAQYAPGEWYASWYIIFSRNELIIAYDQAMNPPYLSNILNGSMPWYAVLNRTDVTFGRSDPFQDPNGAYTLMTWGLADRWYNLSKSHNPQDINGSLFAKDPLMGYTGPGKTMVKAKEVDMDSALALGTINYLFIYKSVAIQQGFGYISLDPHINLGNITYASYYKKVTIHVISPLVLNLTSGTWSTSPDKKGSAIQYGLTIPNNAPHMAEAIDYVKFILGYPGMLINEGQPPYYPAYASNVSKLPAALQPLCIPSPY